MSSKWQLLPCGCSVKLVKEGRYLSLGIKCNSSIERPIHVLCSRLWFDDKKSIDNLWNIVYKVITKLNK